MRVRTTAAGLLMALATLLLAGCGSSKPAPPPSPITVDIQLSPTPAPAASAPRAITTGKGSKITVTIPYRPVPSAAPRETPAFKQAEGHLTGAGIWLPFWNVDAAVAAIRNNTRAISVTYPFWFNIDGTATVVNEVGPAESALVAELKAAGQELVPTVTESAGQRSFAKILTSPAKRRKLISALVWIAEQRGFSGIDLDFENIAIGDGDARATATVANEYPQFVSQVCQALHAVGRVCAVTVVAQTAPPPLEANGFSASVYNYAELGSAADRVQVMAYDDHVPSSASGPIAPMPWVQSVVTYALSRIPAAKIVLGIPAYGYNWASRGHNTTVTAGQAEALARSVHARIGWDQASQEPYFSYRHGRIRHVVWFENSEAGGLRAALAANSHLAGVAVWAAGDQDPGLWPVLAKLR